MNYQDKFDQMMDRPMKKLGRIFPKSVVNRVKAEEFERELRDERIKDLVLCDIQSDGDATSEAVGTQATLSRLNSSNGWQIGQELKELLIQAIERQSDEADQELASISERLLTNT